MMQKCAKFACADTLSVGYSKRTNAGIVLSNSNNGNVMGSQSVSGYHAQRLSCSIQDGEKGK